MTVWVFGSSYAKNYGFKDQWINLVAQNFKTGLISYGLDGCSLDYSYQKFNNNRDRIQDNDIIIFPLTTHIKRWFFKYKPEQNLVFDEIIDVKNFKFTTVTDNDKESEALTAYYTNLNNQSVYETYTINFFYNLQQLTKKKNLHSIILTSCYDTEEWIKDKKNEFPLLNFSLNKLLDVSLLEYSKQYFIDMDVGIHDFRVNHLTRSNHIVLANKIIDNIENKKPIDLTTGFHKHLINKDCTKDIDFVNKELFGGAAFKK